MRNESLQKIIKNISKTNFLTVALRRGNIEASGSGVAPNTVNYFTSAKEI